MQRSPAVHLALAIGILSWLSVSQGTAKDTNEQNEQTAKKSVSAANIVVHNTIEIDGVKIFYREAGPTDAPTVFLLHGYPTSSHMYRHLMRDLADKYHTLAPDYPGYGRSEQPPMAKFRSSSRRLRVSMKGAVIVGSSLLASRL